MRMGACNAEASGKSSGALVYTVRAILYVDFVRHLSMERTAQHDIVADLVELSVRPGDAPRLPKGKRPSDEVLDRWALTAALAEPNAREAAVWAIREAAHAAAVIPASIQSLYAARGQGAWDNRTVPALNLRGWTY